MNQRGSETNDLDCRRAMDDRKRFFVRADEKLTAFWHWKRQLNGSVPLPFCKSERNSFSGGLIAALDSGLRIAKRVHL
jgi:hypothetical protein